MKTFISFIGSNDAGPLIGQDDGAILTVLENRKFDKIILLLDQGGKVRGKDISYSQIADYLKKQILDNKYCRKQNLFIESIEFEDIAYHVDVYKKLLQILESLFPEPQNDEIYAGISSGTPAMQTSWIMMAEADVFPIHLIRSVEKQYARKGQRVYEVELLTGVKEKLSELQNYKNRLGKSAKVHYNVIEDNLNLTETQILIALSDSHILIEGETGVGKEVLARTIHDNSKRTGKKFIALNCAGLSEHLLESELFGHLRGAFTGAFNTKKGIVEEFETGTLFLDEINSVPLSVQSKLLRFLDTGEYRRIGSNDIKISRIRILAAANENMQKLVADGKFREDLYYRLRMYELTIPPLRNRKEQIPVLIKRIALELVFNESGMNLLKNHKYRGNVRELKIILERLKLLHSNSKVSDKSIKEILADFSEEKKYNDIEIPQEIEGKAFKLMRTILTNAALAETGGNTLAAAKILGVTHPSIAKWSQEED